LAIAEPEALEFAAAGRVTPERVRRFVCHLAETNAPSSVACQLDMLYKVARIMMPGCDWTWLKQIKARLHAAAPAPRARGPVITSLQLLELGLQLMDETRSTSDVGMRMADAICFRDGLIIALVAFIPLRRRNLSAIEIGRHLIREGDDWLIIFDADETKTGTSLEYPVHELLNPYLATYLDIVRPRILHDHKGCKALWASPKGGALSYSAMWGVITRNTAARLGIRVAPHDVRDAAATTWAIAVPEKVLVSRDLLGHSNLSMTTRYYNRARGIAASRAHSHVIRKMRKRWRTPS
jgi:integrase/recombinase XerD